MFSDVVIAVKPGEERTRLIKLARSAAAGTAKIHLVTVVQILNENDSAQVAAAEERLVRESADLNDLGQDASHEVKATTLSVALDVLSTAEDRGADPLVIGMRHRSAVGKALLSSDAQKTLVGSTCPTLVGPR